MVRQIALVLLTCALLQAQAPPSKSKPPDEPKPAALKTMKVPPIISEPRLIRRVAPKYPSRIDWSQGRQVRLQGVVDTQGRVKDLKFVSGNRSLASSVIEAVRQWRYRPYRYNGQPIEFQTDITVGADPAPVSTPEDRAGK